MTGPSRAGSDGDPARRFLGGLLMAAGGLIGGLSGLCSAVVSVIMMADPGSLGALASGMAVVAVVGGIPMVFGAAVFFLGRVLHRSGKPRPDPETFV